MPPAKNYTTSQVHNAAKTSGEIMEQSAIVRSCHTAMMLAQQIFSVANSALENNIRNDWDCQDPELVIHHLQNAANSFARKNMTNPDFTIGMLRDNTLNHVLPFLDIIAVAQQDAAPQPETPASDASTNPTAPVLSGCGQPET